MAVNQLKDGRWICYYLVKGPDGKKSKIKREYFGRGPDAEEAANKRNEELGLIKRRPPKDTPGPTFGELMDKYLSNKTLANENAYKMLTYRLKANILPYFENIPAIRIKDNDLDRYIKLRRNKPVKYSTINREISDIQAILNFAASRNPRMIPYNPVRNYKKPPDDDEVIIPPTEREINKILDNAAPHLTRAIILSYYLGLRPGAVELLGLAWPDVNFGDMTILYCQPGREDPKKGWSRSIPTFYRYSLLEKI